MPLDYKAATISVTTAATLVKPNFDIGYISVSSEDGDFYVRIKDESGWGDWIKIVAGVEFSDEFEANAIEIKSASGTINVDYYLRGER